MLKYDINARGNEHQPVAGAATQGNKTAPTQLADNRPVAAVQRKLQEELSSIHVPLNRMNSIQKKTNNTGIPHALKAGIENLSGHSMDDVKVHYNSGRPATLQAHAYAQGTDIHIAPGQEKHLAHEAWHVVQQKQGRVKPTIQLKGRVQVNNDQALENEADKMGMQALSQRINTGNIAATDTKLAKYAMHHNKVTQRQVTENGKKISRSKVEEIMSRFLEHTSLQDKKKQEILKERLAWFDNLQDERFSVDILELYHAHSWEDLVRKLKTEAADTDESLGVGAHAMAEHSAITKEEMAGKLGGRVTSKTKFVDPELFERMINVIKEQNDILSECLEALGGKINELYDPTTGIDPTVHEINVVVDNYFATGISARSFIWRKRGAARVTPQANGQKTITISWQAESKNTFKKLMISADGQDYITAPMIVWGGDNTVSLVVNPRTGVVNVLGLDDELKIQTAY